MSELRVDNIVSQDGTAAPIYSKGLNIGAGQTLTNAGDYSVSGNSLFTGITTFQGGAVYGGGVTVSDNVVVQGSLQVTQASNFNTTGIITCGTLNVSGSTSFGDITGTIGTLTVTNDGTVGGALTVYGNARVEGNLTVDGTTTTIDTAVTSVDSLAVDGNITAGGTIAATGDVTTGGKPVATTGKAIAMAMVFG